MRELQTFDVFTGGEQGYPVYRIPSLITTRKGSVLAFCEGRAGRHDHSENDIVMRTSRNGGESWGPVRIIASDGRNCLNNPQAVVVRETGRILLMYQHSPYGYHAEKRDNWYGKTLKAVEPGYEGKLIRRSYLISSDDEGETWSEPKDLTREVKSPDVTRLASGPGIGIQLRRGARSGRLLMPFNHLSQSGGRQVYAVFSDDCGERWKRGRPAPDGSRGSGNEVQLVGLVDGRVMLNARSVDGTNKRKVAFSEDSGESWSTLEDDPTLIEPMCQGSILRYSDPLDGEPSRILFANPAAATQGDRVNGTVRLSFDEGVSWPVSKVICSGRYAYSCLTVFPDGRIGCLYETGREQSYETIKLAVFSLEWLVGTGKERRGV